MNCRCLGFVVFSIMSCGLYSPAAGEVIEGTGVLSLGGWDFSEQLTVGMYDGDISIVYVVDPPLGWWMSAWNGGGVAVADSGYEELTTAPKDSSLYYVDLPALYGKTYVGRTAEGHYAKFRMIQLLITAVIEYAYQTDGSRLLATPVSGEATTWGRVKALYGTGCS